MANSHERVLRILRLLRYTHAPMRVSEIARDLHIAQSTVQSIVTSLVKEGAIVVSADRRYSPGPATLYLGASYAVTAPLYSAVWGDLIGIAQELRVSALLAVPWEEHHLILAIHHKDARFLGLAPGIRFPLGAGSYGKAYYAWSGAPIPSELRRYTQATIVDPKEYAAEIDRTRWQGYATDNEELSVGSGSVAAAIISTTGYEAVVGLFSNPASLITERHALIGQRLAEIASRGSRVLGYRGLEDVWRAAP
jgi:DNA-binding IclR family transcriptional regulator